MPSSATIHTDDADDALSLRGRRALITGASLGIGRAIARLFAKRGATLVVHHASAVDASMGYADAARGLVRDVRDAGGEAVEVDCDLAQAGAAVRLVTESLAAFGGIDILVICASIQIRQAFGEVTRDTIEQQTRLNFDASVELLQLVLPVMSAQRRGRIISIGSINQVQPHEELAVYAALKAAQHNLIVGVAKRYASVGITANTISPGLIATPRNDFRRRNADEWASIQKSANPMRRAGTPDEVAHVAALLAAPAGAFITGADIAVDGGGRL